MTKCRAIAARRKLALRRRFSMPASIVGPSPSSMLTQPVKPAPASAEKIRS